MPEKEVLSRCNSGRIDLIRVSLPVLGITEINALAIVKGKEPGS